MSSYFHKPKPRSKSIRGRAVKWALKQSHDGPRTISARQYLWKIITVKYGISAARAEWKKLVDNHTFEIFPDYDSVDENNDRKYPNDWIWESTGCGAFPRLVSFRVKVSLPVYERLTALWQCGEILCIRSIEDDIRVGVAERGTGSGKEKVFHKSPMIPKVKRNYQTETSEKIVNDMRRELSRKNIDLQFPQEASEQTKIEMSELENIRGQLPYRPMAAVRFAYRPDECPNT